MQSQHIPASNGFSMSARQKLLDLIKDDESLFNDKERFVEERVVEYVNGMKEKIDNLKKLIDINSEEIELHISNTLKLGSKITQLENDLKFHSDNANEEREIHRHLCASYECLEYQNSALREVLKTLL